MMENRELVGKRGDLEKDVIGGGWEREGSAGRRCPNCGGLFAILKSSEAVEGTLCLFER